MQKGSPICIIMATILEAQPFIDALSLSEAESRPFKLYKNEDIFLVISGIGKANAAMAAVLCWHRFKPGLMYNLGAAGSLKPEYSLGDIFHISEAIEYDRPHLRYGEIRIHTPSVLRGFQTVILATKDIPVVDPEERQEMARNADLVDMEGASIAHACRKLDKGCAIFKFVSDTPDHSDHHDIVENIKYYRTSFCELILDQVLPVIP